MTIAIATAAKPYVTTSAMFKIRVTDAAIFPPGFPPAFPPADLGDRDEGVGDGGRKGDLGCLGDLFAKAVRTGSGAVERDTDGVDAGRVAGPDAASVLVERLDPVDRGVGAAAAGGGPLLVDAVTKGADSPGAGAVVPPGPPADVGTDPGVATVGRMIAGWCVSISCLGSCTAAGRLVW